MSKLLARNIGYELCKALGINPDNIRSIKFNFDANSAVDIDIERYLDSDDIEPIITVLEKYKTTKK